MRDSDKDLLIDEIYEILVKLMELEVAELMGYSTSKTCSEPLEGLEPGYDKQRAKVKLIQEAKTKILLYKCPAELFFDCFFGAEAEKTPDL